MLENTKDVVNLIEKIKNIIISFIKLFKEANDEKRNYYFTHYKKHLTIYKNGTGILIANIKMKAVIPENIKKIERKIDCSDGKACLKFPDFNKMKNVDIAKRFFDYGFWYNSDENIVTNVTNYSSSDKCLNLNFNIDEGKLKKGKVYNISYVISIPNMFPITDGKYDPSTLDANKRKDYRFSSSLKVIHLLEKVDYIISFEQDMKLNKAPKCIIKNSQYSDKPVHGNNDYNLIYKTYYYKTKNPKINSKIEINWFLNKTNKVNHKKYRNKNKTLSIV